MGSLTQRVAGCVGVTLVHCCVFAVCAGRSVRPGGCGWRLQVSQRRENREKCCPDCVGRRGCGCDGCGSVGGAVRMTRSCVVFINATTHPDPLCPTRPVCVLRGLRAALERARENYRTRMGTNPEPCLLMCDGCAKNRSEDTETGASHKRLRSE